MKFEVPKISSEWKHLYDPNKSKFEKRFTRSNRNKWYTNDHCIVKGTDGKWHGYGIIGYKVMGLALPWKIETNLFHISSSDLFKEDWEEHDYALTIDPSRDERFLWAPHCIIRDNNFEMFYARGSRKFLSYLLPSIGNINKATSQDGFNWERSEENPVISDTGNARDPFVLRYNDKFLIYYTTTHKRKDQKSCVAVSESNDLIHWENTKVCNIQNKGVWFAGNTESPFVVLKDGIFYLFVCVALGRGKYHNTKVYWSENPLNFPEENHVCDLHTHESEIIHDPKEGWFISNTGWDKKGLYLAKLDWK
jgi:glycosyl hydrolase family 32